jgi:hypothetical protein
VFLIGFGHLKIKLTIITNTTQPNKQVSAAKMHYAKDSPIDDTDKNDDDDDDTNVGTQTLTSINKT